MTTSRCQEGNRMPTFDTPEPITATIDLAVGDVRITAGESGSTIVDLRPSDPSNADDVKAAELSRVEYANEALLVRTPKLRSYLSRKGGSVDVTVELPTGSQLHGTARLADFHCDGRLGDTRIKTGLGRIHLDAAGTLNLKTGMGDISVEHATGHAEVTTGSGDVRLGELHGSAVIKNSNGPTWVGVVDGDARLNAANGSIAVDLARAGVVAKSSIGAIRLSEVVRGSIVLETSAGDVEVGIREGTAAWLDVHTGVGHVRNALAASSAPEPSSETVEVRARTTVGDVVIRRP
jgi:DUF4097 and DUF4098 domain-containing protein YvlB